MTPAEFSPSAFSRALRVFGSGRRPRSLLGLGLTALLLSSTAVASSSTPAAAPEAPLRILSGWVPYWNGDRGPQGISAMGPLSSSVSQFAYEVMSAERVERRGSPDINARMRQASISAKIPLIPSVFDSTDDGLMKAILANPATRAAHVNALVNVVLDGGYDGIDLDYENFAFEDGYSSWASTKPIWTQFIFELSVALHTYAKLLYVTIPPVYDNNETKASGYWVYDPVAIAPYADRIRIMAYDYSWNIMGPTAPLNWTQTIVDYVAAYLPPSKVELGVPLYGRDWIVGVSGTCPAGVRTSGRTGLRTERAIALAVEKGATPERQPDGEMRFTYTSTYTGPSRSATPPAVSPDPPDGIGPGGPEPVVPLGRVATSARFVPRARPIPSARVIQSQAVPAEDVIWPYPTEDEKPPSTEPPSTEPPSTKPPGTSPPDANPPSTDPPGANPPGPNPPDANPPSTDPPITNPPVSNGPPVTCTVTRTVYYPDAGSTLLKAQQAMDKGLAGIVFFAIGYEEPGHFMALRDVASRVPHAPGVDPIGDFEIFPEAAGRFRVRGWALDPEASLPIIVRISVDGAIRKQLLANDEVPDIGARYPGNGPFHGVDVSLTTSLGRHRVCVQAIGLGAGTTLRWLRCRTVTVTDSDAPSTPDEPAPDEEPPVDDGLDVPPTDASPTEPGPA